MVLTCNPSGRIIVGMIRTVKFKLPNFSDGQMIRDGMRLFDWYLTEIKRLKTCSKVEIHRNTYRYARKKFPQLKSAHIQSVRDHACAVAKRFDVHNGKRVKINKQSLSMAINNRAFSFKGDALSYSTPTGVVEEAIDVLPFQQHIIAGKVQGMVIKFAGGNWWACVSFKLAAPATTKGKSLGIDLGIRNIATLSSGKIYSSKRINKVRRRYRYKRSVLQSIGTRAAKRKLQKLAGRERRFTTNTLHCITKKVAEEKADHFVVEDLTNIRCRGRGKGKRFNRRLSQWPFSQFYFFLCYKAEERGKTVEKVNAGYTSQKCFSCKVVKKSHRRGSWYRCSECTYRHHADINAALNIQSLSKREVQAAVNRPNVALRAYSPTPRWVAG